MLASVSPARAQAPAEGDDLELPSKPTQPAAPPQTGSAPAPSATPAPSAAPAGSATASATPPAAGVAPPTAASAAELAELRRRIEELEKAKGATPPPAADSAKANKPKQPAVVNFERRAHSRAVPLGLKVGGYLQAQYEHSGLSEDQLQQGGAPQNQDRFLLRRGRLRIDHGWQYAAGTLELDANTIRGPSVGIRRAEASILYRNQEEPEGTPLVAATLGVTDIPFGYELGESARTRRFMERSLGSSALFPSEADVGLRVWGAVSFVRYAVALMNGEPLDDRGFPRDPNAAKDLIGRVGVDVKPIELLSVTGGASFATGKGFHPGGQATKDSFTWTDTDLNGMVSTGELVAIPGSASSPSENFERWALGLDLGVTFQSPAGSSRVYGEAFVASNYDRGFSPADPVSVGFDLRETGIYGALLQDVTRYGFAGFRIGYYDPNSDAQEERVGQFVPLDQSVLTLSPLLGLELKDQARLVVQYDFVRDELGRDTRGVPADVSNDLFTVRLQVEL